MISNNFGWMSLKLTTAVNGICSTALGQISDNQLYNMQDALVEVGAYQLKQALTATGEEKRIWDEYVKDLYSYGVGINAHMDDMSVLLPTLPDLPYLVRQFSKLSTLLREDEVFAEWVNSLKHQTKQRG